MSKTPKFDKALNEILEKLTPHNRTCLQCQKDFEIFSEDIEFYKKLQVPPPKLCSDCRMQRRFGFYGNILKFYKKECAAHLGEKVITTFHSESPYKVFDLKHWWSDKWGGEEYGADYDFNRPFFEQFKEFNLKVPQIPLTHYWKNIIDSPYTIGILNSKNCYFTSTGSNLENVHYSYWVAGSRDSADLLNVLFSENCYEIVYGGYCYNVYFSEEVDHCIDSAFLYDCKNCSNCFMCSNLRNKNYYF